MTAPNYLNPMGNSWDELAKTTKKLRETRESMETDTMGQETLNPSVSGPHTEAVKESLKRHLLSSLKIADCIPANPVEGYSSLAAVLNLAYEQASAGKGAERHANNLPFDQQPMQTISGLIGDNHGLLFQAIKKIQEGAKFDSADRTIREYLGAINYIAGAIIYLQNKEAKNG